jgi:hypothetical protein
MRSEKTSLGMILTPDENKRFTRAIFHLRVGRYNRTMLSHLQDDFYLSIDPFERLIDCAYTIGHDEFTQALLAATLEIYHEAQEWIVIFYATALVLSDEVIYEMVDDLVSMPHDHAAFILKVLSKIETEILEQIATNFVRTPYSFSDPAHTRRHFTSIYTPALSKLTALKTRLAAHNLHF